MDFLIVLPLTEMVTPRDEFNFVSSNRVELWETRYQLVPIVRFLGAQGGAHRQQEGVKPGCQS